MSQTTGPITHYVKTLDKFFDDVTSGQKLFEVRLNDRDYNVGDILRQHRYGADGLGRVGYLNGTCFAGDQRDAETIEHKISYILDGGQFGIEKGYVVMQLETLEAA